MNQVISKRIVVINNKNHEDHFHRIYKYFRFLPALLTTHFQEQNQQPLCSCSYMNFFIFDHSSSYCYGCIHIPISSTAYPIAPPYIPLELGSNSLIISIALILGVLIMFLLARSFEHIKIA